MEEIEDKIDYTSGLSKLDETYVHEPEVTWILIEFYDCDVNHTGRNCCLQDSTCHNRVPGPAASALSENSLEMLICGPQPRLIRSKIWGRIQQSSFSTDLLEGSDVPKYNYFMSLLLLFLLFSFIFFSFSLHYPIVTKRGV